MAKRGPKSRFNDKIKETIIRLLKDGKIEEEVADIVGVSPKTISNWKGKNIELLHAVRESKLVADDLVEASLFRRAVGWKHLAPDTTAAMFWLRNRQPERWREKTEGDVLVNNNVTVQALTDEQLDARIAAKLAKVKP
jgi:hypothetical protein